MTWPEAVNNLGNLAFWAVVVWVLFHTPTRRGKR